MSGGLEDLHVDWAACIPPNLQKLHLTWEFPPLDLLEHMVLTMPCLRDVKVNKCLEWSEPFGAEADLVGQCKWEKLAVNGLLTFRDINLFPDLDGVTITSYHEDCRYCWTLDASNPDLEQELASAAEKLAELDVSGNDWLLSLTTGKKFLNLEWLGSWGRVQTSPRHPNLDQALAVIRALAPLAERLPALDLTSWLVTKELMDQVDATLSHTTSIIISSRLIQGCARQRLATISRLISLEAVTSITFSGWDAEAMQIVLAAALHAPRAMTFKLRKGYGYPDCEAITDHNRLVWESAMSAMSKSRAGMGLPAHVTEVLTHDDF